MKIAVCDAEAFYPLRSLVKGPFENLHDLVAIERFVRTVVLHDEIVLKHAPNAYDPETDFEFTEEEKRAGGRLVVTAWGPVLTGFDFFRENRDLSANPAIALSPSLTAIAARFANAGPGNAFFKAHIDFLQSALGVVERGDGSALLCSDFGQEIITTAQKYPDSLFDELDKDWQQFAQAIERERLGFRVPPVLSIILSRCARRDAIPIVLQELREEWADARQKVWQRIDALRVCHSFREAEEINRELSDASKLFFPKENEVDSRPIRMLWEIVGAVASGAVIAEISSGKPIVGAVTGGITQVARSMPGLLQEFGPALFGRGAFDLANKVRREVASVEVDALSRLLTDTEKQELQIS